MREVALWLLGFSTICYVIAWLVALLSYPSRRFRRAWQRHAPEAMYDAVMVIFVGGFFVGLAQLLLAAEWHLLSALTSVAGAGVAASISFFILKQQ